jgi:hypothetical protein
MSEGRGFEDEAWAEETHDVKPLAGRDKVRARAVPKPRKPAPPFPEGARASPALEQDALRAQNSGLQASLAALQAKHDALLSQHAALHSHHAALRAELDATRTVLAALQAEHLALREARTAPAPPSEPTPRPLAQAGLSDAQLVATLDRLLAADRKLCARALLRDGDASAWHAIDDRVVLACALCSARLRPGVVAVEGVTAADCDLCGGSDTRRAFADLVAACEVAQVGRVLILGGSPAYREEAQRLVKETTRPLKIDFVGEGSKPGTKKALANARGADVLVVWCSTLLDHATTDAFGKVDALRVVVNRRGIGSMFAQVAEALMSRSGST